MNDRIERVVLSWADWARRQPPGSLCDKSREAWFAGRDAGRLNGRLIERASAELRRVERGRNLIRVARLLGALLLIAGLLVMALQLTGCDRGPVELEGPDEGSMASTGSTGGSEGEDASTGEPGPDCVYFYGTCFCDGEATEPLLDDAGDCLCGDQAIEAEACEPMFCEQMDFGGPGLLCSCSQGAARLEPQWDTVEEICYCGQTPVGLTPDCYCGDNTHVLEHPELCCEYVGGVCLCGGEVANPSVIEGVCACGLTPLDMELCEA